MFGNSTCTPLKSCVISADLWHAQLGHPSFDVQSWLFRVCNLGLCLKNINTQCRTCLVSKSHCLPFIVSNTRALRPFDLVHIDLWGPSLVKSVIGAMFYILFVDDYPRYSCIYFLSNKSQALSVFKCFML